MSISAAGLQGEQPPAWWNNMGKGRASQVALVLKNLPASVGDSRGWEDPLEKQMATHSSILAWRIPRTEEPDGPHSMGLQRVGHD